jgi:predicted DNA-binding transcriptional regulator YafY
MQPMRRADRLFDIIQTLRGTAGPLTAAALAEKLEVTARTIYRDVAALQASRMPIEGAAGIGYVLRRGRTKSTRSRSARGMCGGCAIRSCRRPPKASLPK